MWTKSLAQRIVYRCSTQQAAKVLLPDLKFAYSALEPVISSKLL